MNFSTLFFFGIEDTSSSSVFSGTGNALSNQPTVCNTKYHDKNQNKVGYSQSVYSFYAWTNQPGSWSTTYYDHNSKIVGYSQSVCTFHAWTNQPGSWRTTYQDHNRNTVGYSLSVCTFHAWTNQPGTWATTHEDNNRINVGRSNSSCIGSTSASWNTNSSFPVPAAQYLLNKTVQEEIAQEARYAKEARKAYERLQATIVAQEKFERERPEREARHKAAQEAYRKRINEICNAVGVTAEMSVIPKLKKYYVSQAGFFNASSEVFACKDVDTVISVLRSRAKWRPIGASAKTLEHFGLRERPR